MEQTWDDNRLWESFRSGEEKAFVQLFHRYSDPLFFYGCSLSQNRPLIKDAIQELLCDLWERRSALPSVNNLKFYLFAAFRRILLRKLEQDRKYTTFPDSKPPIGQSSWLAPSREETIIFSENQDQSAKDLKQAIQALPPRQKEALHLRYFQGLSYAEMAEVMNVRPGTVGRFIVQSIQALRKKMNQNTITLLLSITLIFV